MPAVSVITPVYNDFPGLRSTVDSLSRLSTDVDWEYIVVDNGSTDGTRERAATDVADRVDGAVLTENDVQSSYAARNTGIRHADGDVLAFIDADMTVPDGWLDDALAAFRASSADYMGCDVDLVLPDEPGLAARFDHHTGFPVGYYLDHQGFAPTCCLFVRREVFADVGLFDHRLTSGGDKEFGNRVREAGYDLTFADDVAMFHPTRESIPALVSKDLRVGRGLCQLQCYHPDRYGTPGIPPRPSGVKRPDPDLGRRERLAFGALSRFLTGVRGIGYYREYADAVRDADGTNERGVPTLESAR
jgi:glycosyltransferase AglI